MMAMIMVVMFLALMIVYMKIKCDERKEIDTEEDDVVAYDNQINSSIAGLDQTAKSNQTIGL